jgi:hypothetical protein
MNTNNNDNPAQSLMNMINGAKGLIAFTKNALNDPNLPPEAKAQAEKHLAAHGFWDKEKELEEVRKKMMNHFEPNNAKQ